MLFLPLDDGQVERSSFHGRCCFRDLGASIETLESRTIPTAKDTYAFFRFRT